MDYQKLIGKAINILCVFGDSKVPIYYDAVIIGIPDDKHIIITDRFNTKIILDIDSIKQIKIIGDDLY